MQRGKYPRFQMDSKGPIVTLGPGSCRAFVMPAERNPKMCRGTASSVVPRTRVGGRQEGKYRLKMSAAERGPMTQPQKPAWLLGESRVVVNRFCRADLSARREPRANALITAVAGHVTAKLA